MKIYLYAQQVNGREVKLMKDDVYINKHYC